MKRELSESERQEARQLSRDVYNAMNERTGAIINKMYQLGFEDGYNLCAQSLPSLSTFLKLREALEALTEKVAKMKFSDNPDALEAYKQAIKALESTKQYAEI